MNLPISGQLSIPRGINKAFLFKVTVLTMLINWVTLVGFVFHSRGQPTITVLCRRPPKPAVCISELQPSLTFLVTKTEQNPFTFSSFICLRIVRLALSFSQ